MANKSEEILVLNDREHVRLRPTMYIGSTFASTFTIPTFTNNVIEKQEIEIIPAIIRLVCEIIENSMDEFYKHQPSSPQINLTYNSDTNTITVEDNGRGIPILKHSSGKYIPEVVLTELRSGRNFTQDKEQGTIGQNGVGSTCVNFCSETMIVEVHDGKKKYIQKFEKGASIIHSPEITNLKTKDTKTSITFTIDSTVFNTSSPIPVSFFKHKLHDLCCWNTELTCNLTYISSNSPQLMKFSNKNAFKGCLTSYISKNGNGCAIYKCHTEMPLCTSINSAYLYDGGSCNKHIEGFFVEKINAAFKKKYSQKRITVDKKDIFSNIGIISNFMVSDPIFDSQAKIRFKGPDIKNTIITTLELVWTQFSSHTDILDEIFNTAIERYNTSTSKKIQKDFSKNKFEKIEGLMDATSTNRSNCSLLITEGDSASSCVSEVRDPTTIGSIALTGKINNVSGASVADLMNMSKIKDLLKAIGLIPGKPANINDLRYGKIVIATDADPDGNAIFCLLVNIFHTFWPELFTQPVIFRMVAPNVVASKQNKRIHFPTMSTFMKQQSKYKTWTIEYMKGLGSMSFDDWKICLKGTDWIPILDDGELKDTLSLLFSDNRLARKEWLMNNDVIDTVNTSDYIRQQYKEFSIYTLDDRALLHSSDGLRNSIRRLLWTAQLTNSKLKTINLSGRATDIHPHGDASEVIQNYTAPFKMNYPLFNGHGSFGTRLTPKGYGASRYTSVEISEFARRAVLVDLDLVPMIPNYDHTTYEPKHFLPLVPYGLLNDIQGIAVGFTCDIAPRKLQDVIENQIRVLKKQEQTPIRPFFKPLNQYVATHNDQYRFEGKLKYDEKKKILHLLEEPFGKTHAQTIKTINKLLEDKIIYNYTDDSSSTFNIKIDCRNSDYIQILDQLKFFSNVKEHMNFIDFDGQTVITLTDNELIEKFTIWRLAWYKQRFEKELNTIQQKNQKVLDVINTIRLIEDGIFDFNQQSKKTMEQLLSEHHIINTDYVSSLPVYRFTVEEKQKLLKEHSKMTIDINRLQELINSELKRKNVYIKELEQLFDSF